MEPKQATTAIDAFAGYLDTDGDGLQAVNFVSYDNIFVLSEMEASSRF